MTAPGDSENEGAEDTEAAEERAARRRRLAAVFGDVPGQTRDDHADPTDEARAATESDAARDTWLRGQVPPHHG